VKRAILLVGVATGIALSLLFVLLQVCTARAALTAGTPSISAPAEVQSSEIIVSGNVITSRVPAVVYNPDRDEYLVVWRSQQTDGYDVRGQRLDGKGFLVGDSFTITSPIGGDRLAQDDLVPAQPPPPTSTVLFPRLPAIAYNATQGEYLVVWSDEVSKTLRGQRVLSDGVLTGSPFTIPTSLSDDPHSPGLVYAPEHDLFLLAWRGCVQDQLAATASPGGGGDSCYFYTQILDATGVTIGENVTATTATYVQGYPALTYVPGSDAFWIVWTELYTITARRVLTTGLLADVPFTIAQGTTEMRDPSISNISGRGELLVTWSNTRDVLLQQSSDPMGGGYSDIYAQRVMSTGVPAGESFRVSSTGNAAIEPRTIYLPGWDQYFVVWGNVDYVNHNQNVHARWMSATDDLVGHDFPVVVAPEDQHCVAAAGSGPVLVVWEDERGGPDIRGRIPDQPTWMYLPLMMNGGESSVAFELGGHIADQSFPHAAAMYYAGMTWAKVTLAYDSDAASIISAAHARGFKIQITAVGPPDMVTQAGFEQAFTRWVATIAAAGADGIEVWSEPNVDRAWPSGMIDPQAYTSLLCASYAAIKAVNPNTLVISAAPVPTGYFGGCGPTGCDDLPFLQGMINAGATQCMDYVGAHHTSGATSPSARSGHPADDGLHHHSWYFLPQTELYYQALGGTRQLFYTSMGYASQEGVPTFSDGWAWARGITDADQAAWLAEAAQLSIDSGMVRAIVVWNIDFERLGDEPRDGYAIIRPGGSCPACDALHDVLGAP
jgi:hypothetical protein